MKLVLLLRSSYKYSPKFTPLSTKLHCKNMDVVPFLTVGKGGQFETKVDTPKDLVKAMWAICDKVGDENFVLSSDNAFPVAPFDPSVLRCRLRSNWNKRNAEGTAAMVETVGYLMDLNTRVFDYEMNIPRVIDSGKMQSMLATTEGMNIHAITTYFNMYFDHPERYADPHMEMWVHSDNPKGPVVSLSDTCYRHKKCYEWLSKKLKQK